MLTFATSNNNIIINTLKRFTVMKTSIIINNINGQQFNELRDFMQNAIRESMNALDSHDAEGILWYEDCTMGDYFKEWTEIWDEDERIGDGLDTIAHKFVLSDDTRPDFENAFEQARDAAFEEYMRELGEEIESEYEGESFDELEFGEADEDGNEWDGEVEGYTRIGDDNTLGTTFLEGMNGDLYDAINNAMTYGLKADVFAAWVGATAWAHAESNEYCDWRTVYYKKNEPKTIFCDLDFCDLYIQAEGGWDGWYHPVWAKIVKDEDGDYIELSLGDQVSNGTTFRDNDGSTPKSWVGNIEVWRRTWGKDDAEAWAEEFNLNPEDFDSDEELFHEVEGRDLDGCFEEAIEEIKQNIIEYAKSEGYDEVEF